MELVDFSWIFCGIGVFFVDFSWTVVQGTRRQGAGMVRGWCRDGAGMVQSRSDSWGIFIYLYIKYINIYIFTDRPGYPATGCKDGARMVQGWCKDGARMVQSRSDIWGDPLERHIRE